jgi:Transposase DNA-binding/Transposase DDE domain
VNKFENNGFWIQEEISKADFGDVRLNKRFQTLAAELAARPSCPINQASIDWASAKGAYRFFSNSKVSIEKILEPHFLSTQLRASVHQRVIVAQDTSVIDFTSHPKTKGLGPTGKKRDDFESQGLLLHSALALSEKGLPLGLLDQKIWPRSHKKEKNSYLRGLLPVEEKESFKWFESLRQIDTRTKNQEVVLVCDREGDIYELFEECLTRGIDFVIRARNERILEDEDFGDIGLFERIGIKREKELITVEVPSTGKRAARQAELEIKFLPVTYAGQPRGSGVLKYKNRSDLDLFVVHLHEPNPPQGEQALNWTLITSLPVQSLGEALEIVRIYKLRWNVELYFKCLKTGCGIETCRLATAERLKRFISLQSIIAWRILWMTFLNRSAPEISCENVLTPSEWKTLWLKHHQRQIQSGKLKPYPPNEPPSTYDAVRWIAMLGGFLGRKNDGKPGLITIWRGWLELSSAVEIYQILQ